MPTPSPAASPERKRVEEQEASGRRGVARDEEAERKAVARLRAEQARGRAAACDDEARTRGRVVKEDAELRAAMLKWFDGTNRDFAAGVKRLLSDDGKARGRVGKEAAAEWKALHALVDAEAAARRQYEERSVGERGAVERAAAAALDDIARLHRARAAFTAFARFPAGPRPARGGYSSGSSGRRTPPRGGAETIDVASAAARKDGVVYLVRVRCGGADWTAEAGYDAFAALRDALARQGCRPHAAFPGRAAAAIGSLLSQKRAAAVVEERRVQLGAWVKEAAELTRGNIDAALVRLCVEREEAAASCAAAQAEAAPGGGGLCVERAEAARAARRREREQWFAEYARRRQLSAAAAAAEREREAAAAAAAGSLTPPPGPGVHSVAVDLAISGGQHARFAVSFAVGDAPRQEQVRRYSSFLKLRAEIGPFARVLSAQFPPKSLRRLKPGDKGMEERRVGLERWLRELASRAGAYWTRAEDNRLRALLALRDGGGLQPAGSLGLSEEEAAELAELEPRNEAFIQQGVEVMALAVELATSPRGGPPARGRQRAGTIRSLGGLSPRSSKEEGCPEAVDPSDASLRLRQFLGALPGWADAADEEDDGMYSGSGSGSPPSPRSPGSSPLRLKAALSGKLSRAGTCSDNTPLSVPAVALPTPAITPAPAALAIPATHRQLSASGAALHKQLSHSGLGVTLHKQISKNSAVAAAAPARETSDVLPAQRTGSFGYSFRSMSDFVQASE